MELALLAGLAAVALILANLASMGLAVRRWLKPAPALPDGETPAVSIVRPLCGLEAFSRETLEASFHIDWPDYETLFCVQRRNDPIIPLVEEAIARHQTRRAMLLVGDDPISPNPKLNNCVKGWAAARHDYIVLADSNALVPPDYIARLHDQFRPDTGLVVSMPLGTRPDGFLAEVECAVLNTYQSRWQFASEAVGMGFAQGKNMMWKREVLENAGGIGALASEIAEDAASTKAVRCQGLRVRLVDRPFEQPLGKRSARGSVGSAFPLGAPATRLVPVAFRAGNSDRRAPAGGARRLRVARIRPGRFAGAAAVVVLLYGAELTLAALARFPLSWRMPGAMIVRDLALPVLWIDAWLNSDFTWHGQEMSVKAARQ